MQDIITKKKRPTQVARELNVAENTLIKWRKLYASCSQDSTSRAVRAEHGETAFQPLDDTVETLLDPKTHLRAGSLTRERLLEKKIAELERVLGQTSFENSVMKPALDFLTIRCT